MRSDTKEGGVKGCNVRRSLPKVLQEEVWGDNFDHGRYHDISLGKDSG